MSEPTIPIWVRGVQPRGGRSKWHLLADHRAGQRDRFELDPVSHDWQPHAEAWVFDLTACGYALTDASYLPGTETAGRNYRERAVLLPLTKASICLQCREVGELLALSRTI
jgi:hypothetical protein